MGVDSWMIRFRAGRPGVAIVAVAAIGSMSVGSSQPPSAQPPLIRTAVDLVVVDVQVVDRSGRPVTSLRPEDFQVSIGGGRRRVVSAELIQHSSSAEPSGSRERAAATASPAAAAAESGRRFVIAIDEHSFRPAAARAAMQAAGRFIDNLQPADLVGLYTYPTGATYSDLTTDHAAVRRGLDRVVGVLDTPVMVYNLSKSEIVDISSGDNEALRRVAQRECRAMDMACSRGIYGEAISLAGMFEMQVTQSLGGLRQLIGGLAKLEGRKTVVLVSGGLFSSDRGTGRVNLSSEIQQIGRETAASNANLYVLHLDSSFIDAFSERRGPSPTLFRDSNSLAAGLEMIAGAAGGALFRVQAGTGDNAFQRVLRENSAYFLLGVEPEAKDRDGEPHVIDVRVRLRGATVRHRTVVTVPRAGS
jgi:VWFA-related protein